LKVHLLYIGKPRSREANVLIQEYAVRLGRYCRFEARQIKDESAAAAYERALRIVLDPAGEQISSRELAALIEKAGRDVAFFVGGADGFSGAFRARADRLLSLSKMTLPHELARVVLAEQIYRAFTILHNHPYPRE
jgi:23S rRNA (pseudouridine1915-N3)-methyltransferase